MGWCIFFGGGGRNDGEAPNINILCRNVEIFTLNTLNQAETMSATHLILMNQKNKRKVNLDLFLYMKVAIILPFWYQETRQPL